MARQKGFYWKSDTLRPGVKGFPQRVDRAVTAATEYGATWGEGQMRRRAPWTDRTGNARAGLFTEAEHSPTQHRVIFAHSVPYGIYLETRWSGRYQVIVPVMLDTGRKVMSILNKLVAGLK